MIGPTTSPGRGDQRDTAEVSESENEIAGATVGADLACDDGFLVIDGDGLLGATPDGRRTVVNGSRVLLPARPWMTWLEDASTGIQAISS